MNRYIILISTLSLFYVNAYAQSFSGKIQYTNTFTDLKNNDITDRMSSFFGKEKHYFINDSNYKAYNQNNRLAYLYNSSTNTYYSSGGGNSKINKTDASTKTTKLYSTKMLPEKITICGYECISMEENTESSTTVYFFSPLVRIDKTSYAKHNFGNWNAYLAATNGALPLKHIYTDKKNGYIWTCTAREIKGQLFTQSDFDIDRESAAQQGNVPQADWLVYNAKDWKVNFPDAPVQSTKIIPTAIGDQTMHIYMYQVPQNAIKDNMVYSVIQTIFPDSVVNSDKTDLLEDFFRNSVDGAVKNVEGRLLSESSISYNSYPGREIKIAFHNDAAIINARLYLVKNSIYFLQAICEKSQDNNESVKIFMESFALKN